MNELETKVVEAVWAALIKEDRWEDTTNETMLAAFRAGMRALPGSVFLALPTPVSFLQACRSILDED